MNCFPKWKLFVRNGYLKKNTTRPMDNPHAIVKNSLLRVLNTEQSQILKMNFIEIDLSAICGIKIQTVRYNGL